ncbi:MAG: iron ABC transporter permease [Anaerolineales bacterium]|nr:iron ABC transporter permease [Anaerolineales bacterium]
MHLTEWLSRAKRYQRSGMFQVAVLVALVFLLFSFMIRSVSTNQVATTEIDSRFVIDASLDALANKAGFDYDSGLDYTQRSVKINVGQVNDIRWPRVLMAALVGAALALAGSTLQGIFRNPLADPGLIGVSSGAAVGAITAILMGLNFSRFLDALPYLFVIDPSNLSGVRFAQMVAAFGMGLLMTLLVYRLSRLSGRTSTTNLLLVGLAVNSIGGAYVGLATYIGNEKQTTDIIFWSLGSVANTKWEDVYLILPFVIIGAIILPFYSRQLNVMTLGEDEAHNLGVNTERLRRVTTALSALLVGVSVGFAGMIAFVGLVIPHLMRLIMGPDHRIVLPTSMLGGAIFLVAADMFGRTLPNPTSDGITVEIPVGILTALVGGPLFLLLILQMRRD